MVDFLENLGDGRSSDNPGEGRFSLTKLGDGIFSDKLVDDRF